MDRPAERPSHSAHRPRRRTVGDLITEVGSHPLTPADLNRPDPFETDQEVELFLAWVAESRKSDVG